MLTKCARVAELLSPYLDGELPDRASGYVKAHLQRCKRCSREFARLHGVQDRVQSIGEFPISPEFQERVMAAIALPVPTRATWMERAATALERVFSTPLRRTAGAFALGVAIAVTIVLPSTGVEFKVESTVAAGTAPGSRLSASVDRMLTDNGRIAPIGDAIRHDGSSVTPINGG